MSKKTKRRSLVLLLVASIFLICVYYVSISYNKIATSRYSIEANQISNSINIVIISDLHDNELGKNNKKLIDEINSLSPDIIIVAGDMINSDSKDSKIVTNLMKQLCENHKVFYSLGNTDIDYMKTGTSNLVKELEDVEVTVLDNEYKDIDLNGNKIRIGGMYAYAFGLNGNNNVDKNTMEEGIFDFLNDFQDTDNYKIMMAHRPDSFIFGNASKVWNIDLVVSGHNHGGQVVLPFVGGLYGGDQGWFPKYDKGLFDLNKIKLLITSGLGSGKQKLPRFNNPPELVNLKISNK
ncbi:metallophosphoesterase [Terrisporobacter petrolearius]|uniref:metallophosphoesterase n=1 Tax=Terrisporobacter petrolearius TaxID=1460447 RepID=UPI001D166A57|nr:metallophosphoesterase [Terrisporobacter petrolearius]MCC3865792.1 metallophosphoesterase [Terrisporobacter petrolearius]